MNAFRLLLILTIFTSCSALNINNTQKTTTLFEADRSLLNEIENPLLAYYDLSGLQYFTSSLDSKKKILFLDNNPILIRCGSAFTLVYPGDDICLRISQNSEILFEARNNEKRNNELVFLNNFQNQNLKIKPFFQGRNKDYPIDTILLFEKDLKASLPIYINRSQKMLDSLAKHYCISDSFKTMAYSILKNEQNAILHYFYKTYEKELNENNLYQPKIREILPLFNQIVNKQEIYYGAVNRLISLSNILMKIKIQDIKSEAEFTSAVNDITDNFSNLSKDFLLTKLLNHIVTKRIYISKKSIRYYKKKCDDIGYEKIGTKLLTERNSFNNLSKKKKDNRMIAISNSKIYTLEEIINNQKGKLILIDLWASWCAPCIAQMPKLKILQQQFPKDKITFLFLSTDRDRIQWQQKSTDIGIDSNYSFVFENYKNRSFIIKNKVETIPRYILLDQDGQIINGSAPKPESPELKKLIEAHL